MENWSYFFQVSQEANHGFMGTHDLQLHILYDVGWSYSLVWYAILAHRSDLLQSCVRSPSVWTWRPWCPGSNPSMVPSIKQRSCDNCRKRTTPWTFPTPASMATAAPRSVTEGTSITGCTACALISCSTSLLSPLTTLRATDALQYCSTSCALY